MVTIRNKLKKIVWAILTTLGIGTLVSCYGMPPNGFYTCVQGTVTDSDTNAIQGIHVTVKNDGCRSVAETDEEGYYCVELFANKNKNLAYTIEFKDIDGTANGSFKPKSENVRFYNEDSFLKDVELEEDK